MVFVTDSNRPQPLWQPPPTACLTASDVPSLLMHPCPPPPALQIPKPCANPPPPRTAPAPCRPLVRLHKGTQNINADRWIYLNTKSYTAARFSFNLHWNLGTDIQDTNFNELKSKIREFQCHQMIADHFPHPDTKCDPFTLARARRASRLRAPARAGLTLGIPIYYINLDHRTDRRVQMEMMLANEQFVRHGATTPADVHRMLANRTLVCKARMVTSFRTRSQFSLLRKSMFSFAEVATTHSHLTAIRRAYERKDEVALILEDDIELARSAKEVLPLPLPLPACTRAVLAQGGGGPKGCNKKGKGPRRRPQRRLGGWGRLPKRLGAVTVGYKCH